MKQYQAAATPPEPGEIARLSSLLYERINMLGLYDFTLSESIAAGQLRPLRALTSLAEQLAQLP